MFLILSTKDNYERYTEKIIKNIRGVFRLGKCERRSPNRLHSGFARRYQFGSGRELFEFLASVYGSDFSANRQKRSKVRTQWILKRTKRR